MTTTTGHPQGIEGSELPNLTRQVGELVVVELAKKSVLTRCRKLRLTQSSLSALRRPISGGIVTKRFSLNCTATRQQRADRRVETHVQVRQLRHDQHARRDLGEGVVPQLLEKASTQRHENNKRRTLRSVTRARCAMLSDTATSCRKTSCGEQGTREAMTKRKKKNAHPARLHRAALASARQCRLLSSHQEQFRRLTCRGAARARKCQSSRLTGCVARVASMAE